MIHNYKSILCGVLLSLLIGAVFLYKKHYSKELINSGSGSAVEIISGGTFQVPPGCQQIALLGSTPHPTEYLYVHAMDCKKVANLQLQDFLDVRALKQTFVEVLNICKKQNIDVLLIAYLPVYFATLKTSLHDQCTNVAYDFFHTIAPQVQKVIHNLHQEIGSTTKVILHIPTQAQCAEIPDQVPSSQRYTQFLVKHFPRLNGIDKQLKKITIINTKVDDQSQTDDIIKYFQYEYLLQVLIDFDVIELEQKKFHTYCTYINKGMV